MNVRTLSSTGPEHKQSELSKVSALWAVDGSRENPIIRRLEVIVGVALTDLTHRNWLRMFAAAEQMDD